MNQLRIIVFLLTLLTAAAAPGAAAVKHLYVSDILVVSLREGPSKSYRSITTVKSGTRLTVLGEENKFVKVRLDNGTEGWIPRQYTLSEPPKAEVIKSLNREVERLSRSNEELSAKAEALARQASAATERVRELERRAADSDNEKDRAISSLREELAALQKSYQTLKQTAGDAIDIRRQRDNLKKETAALRQRVAELKQQAGEASRRDDLYWFLAGGGVLLLGWLLGRLPSRRQSRPSLTL